MSDDPLELDTVANPRHAVIWLHGLGADGHDFEGVVPALGLPPDMGLRFVFPHAPVRPVTVNGGVRMRAWYDIFGFSADHPQDREGLLEAESSVRGLMAAQRDRGIDRIVLAGFSQGGAVALWCATRAADHLHGVLALSTYMPLPAEVPQASEAARQLPILMHHGTQDTVLPLQLGQASCEHLQGLGYAVSWKQYPMAHEVSTSQLGDIRRWLLSILKRKDARADP